MEGRPIELSVSNIETNAESVHRLQYRVHEVAPAANGPDGDWVEWAIEQQLAFATDTQAPGLLSALRSDVAVEVGVLLELSGEASDWRNLGGGRAFEAVASQYANQLTRIARMVRAS